MKGKSNWTGFCISWGWTIGVLIILWILNPVISKIVRPDQFNILMLAGINIIFALSLNLINGITGQFSIGHAGFAAIGAYVSAILTKYFFLEHLLGPLGCVYFIAALLIGGCAAAIAGVLVGLPSLRLRGDYLAIATLGFGEIIRVILFNVDKLGSRIDLGGATSFKGIPIITDFFWVYALAFLTTKFVVNIMKSSHGRAFVSIREDELASELMGVNTTYYKVLAFVVGAFFAGLGGGLFGHYLGLLNPAKFNFILSVEIIVMVVLGGMGSLSGSILAAVILTILPEWLRNFTPRLAELIHPVLPSVGEVLAKTDLRMIIYSLILILLMLTRPKGLLGHEELSWRTIKRLFCKKPAEIAVNDTGGGKE